MMPITVERGKQYWAIRCSEATCADKMAYAEIPDDPDARKAIEAKFAGQVLDCPICKAKTVIGGGFTLLVR